MRYEIKKWRSRTVLSLLVILLAFCVWFFFIMEEVSPGKDPDPQSREQEAEDEANNGQTFYGSAQTYEKLAEKFGINDILILPDKDKISFVSGLLYEYAERGNKIIRYDIISDSGTMPQLYINVTSLDNITHSGVTSETLTYREVVVSGYTMRIDGVTYDIMSQDTEKTLEIVKNIIDLAMDR